MQEVCELTYDKEGLKWNQNVPPLGIKNFTVCGHSKYMQREKSVGNCNLFLKITYVNLVKAKSESLAVVCWTWRLNHLVFIEQMLLGTDCGHCSSTTLLPFLCGAYGSAFCPPSCLVFVKYTYFNMSILRALNS